ncbi:MAG: type II toxin-antitoxin system VapB family antitoxin [Actinobacteria bacterium]|jgi:hypothetical protein|nr:type II toxin-antitoxin system VapB family antitoxin [Actinomycetota bacterium]
MRTTIRLDDGLLEDAKRLAVARNTTLTKVIEDALRAVLARSREGRSPERIELPAFDGGSPLPGVDLDDSAALLDLMEEP